ncbi:tRNA 4-thiouridine(8) synthase ThiI [Methanobrevibacter sp. OttesenSCG-928-K11]|nr:tRNA 4-thiouridine(8) synthase ThiI [Methanobrevibacter sp. OttesenSCG-928-K11]MDL2270549.1 tRNA 4-thiouridine(8) synthase ThiI [Methanobrevibacter sp. OttesenSCG-928-I08]
MEHSVIIARYGEVGLKSPKIRSKFERKLVKNIKASIDCEVERNQGRIYIYPTNFDEAISKLDKIFGIVSYSPACVSYTNFDDIEKTLKEYALNCEKEGLIDSKTRFAIRCRRVGSHDFTSQELAAYCGSVVVSNIGSPVDLTNPEFIIYVEVREDETYIFHEKIEGPGGLPLGTQGKVISLLSSGIDSPVATYMMMKRGCEVIALHFDNQPFTTEKGRENFEDLVDALQVYSSGVPIKSKVVKFGNYLEKVKKDAPEKMTCVLCKSGMYKTAELLANEIGALAIVEGSSVGQVASQTLPNILATRNGVEIPILSPLIGLDKREIEKIADKIGTFEISKRDDGGCKAVPKYPETRAELDRVKDAQNDMDQKKEVYEAFKNIS